MALGALIGAYQEDDTGGLRALLPLAGRTLIEYQARCAAAAGAAPVIVMVERIPQPLNEAFERLRDEGVSIIPVSDAAEGATRFEAGSFILLVGDGVAPPAELLATLVEEGVPIIATVPDDEAHAAFERIDAASRWAGVAMVDGRTLGSTAAMLGDWDLQSTLLRRALQDGAALFPVAREAGDPLLAETPEDLADFERRLFVASRGARSDWASRYALPIVEEFATERLMQTQVRPAWLVYAALALTAGAAFAFTRGWLWQALLMLVVSAPLDLIGRRLANLRLRPLPARMLARRMLWPAAGIALFALSLWLWRHGAGWGAPFAALTTAGFAQALKVEQGSEETPGDVWLFSRRNAILLAVPFAAFGAWPLAIVVLGAYAAASFFLVQHVRHRIARD